HQRRRRSFGSFARRRDGIGRGPRRNRRRPRWNVELRAERRRRHRSAAARRGLSEQSREQTLEPSLERDPVVARERLSNTNERRNFLRDRKSEREGELLLRFFRERLRDRDDEPVAIDRQRRELSFERDLGRDHLLRVDARRGKLTRRRRRKPVRL